MKRNFLLLLLLLTILSGSSAHRVLYIGDSITDGGWGRSGGSAKASKDRNHTDLNHVYVIIVHDRIRAAGCILPVSHDLQIPKELGLRHRAALGITHESDCIAIVVSEETGGISIAIRNEFQLRLTAEKLESILTQELA